MLIEGIGISLMFDSSSAQRTELRRADVPDYAARARRVSGST
jgi:hypothetical protein